MNEISIPNRQRPPLVILACLTVLLILSLVFGQWPDYAQLTATLDHPLSRLRWIVGDISEVAFYKHELPALGLLLGACLAHWAGLRGYRWQGFAICCGRGCSPARCSACCLATSCGGGRWLGEAGNRPSSLSCRCRLPWYCCLAEAGR